MDTNARVDGTPALIGWVHTCERCGERMAENHCKIICPNCGMCRDCSDP
jgi:hypothetical protein